MAYEDLYEAHHPGLGQGQGNPRQGTGGFGQCVCPQCGYKAAHNRGAPCNSMSCPKCGVSLTGG